MSADQVVQPVPYHVEPGGEICDACGEGRRFDVVGPDGVAAGISFDEEVDAEEYAGALSGAFWKGHAAALRHGIGGDGVRMTLQSTAEIEAAPPPARIWRGHTADGTPVVAFITIGAIGIAAAADTRLRKALETRITSSADITIPVPA